MNQRYDLDAAVAPRREGLGSGWSRRKRLVVGSVCVVVAAGALAGGVYAMIASMPPGMPETADEAVRVMGSDKFDMLDDGRKAQYAAEAGRLLAGLSDEERRELLRGRENREALRNLMMETVDENARRLARGEPVQWPGLGWGRRGDGEGRPRPPRREELTDEERRERRERFNRMVREQISTGNSQDSALRGEMFQRMMQGGGPGRGRGGGNDRSGGEPGPGS